MSFGAYTYISGGGKLIVAQISIHFSFICFELLTMNIVPMQLYRNTDHYTNRKSLFCLHLKYSGDIKGGFLWPFD